MKMPTMFGSRDLVPLAAVLAFAVSLNLGWAQGNAPKPGPKEGAAKPSAQKEAAGKTEAGSPKTEAAKPAVSHSNAYPLTTCIISGKKLSADAVVKTIDGREVRFCCNDCPEDFEKNKEASFKKLDDAIIAAEKPVYPLDTCVGCGKKLGEGTPTVDVAYNNRLVRLCSAECAGHAKPDMAALVAKLDQAVVEKQAKDYPLETCVVSGEKLGAMGKPVYYVYGGHLVEFCCNACKKDFDKDPAKYMAKIADAKKSPSTESAPAGKTKDTEKKMDQPGSDKKVQEGHTM